MMAIFLIVDMMLSMAWEISLRKDRFLLRMMSQECAAFLFVKRIVDDGLEQLPFEIFVLSFKDDV